MLGSVFASGWHEVLFGTVLANLAIMIAILRYVMKISNKYKKKIRYFFEKIDIMWFEYGAQKYKGFTAMEIHNKLSEELELYVGRN